MKTLEGVLPVMPAPFTDHGALDLEAVGPLVEFAVACRARQVCLPAYGSEFYKLTDDEKISFIAAVVQASRGRLTVVGQCNHTGAVHAAELARKAEAAGADLVAVALPHLFPTSDEDLARYAQTVCDAVKVPVMLQDFNPGGYTVGADFCAKLSERCDNFRYIKLEEPRMGPKMLAIHQATGGKVGVLEGWGGLYMPELVPQGCIGSVPGFVLSDLLVRIFELLKAGDKVAAFEIFCEVVPFINFSLENFELYHHAEKQLLVQRGVLKSAHVRDLTTHLDPGGETYLAFLAERLWATLDRFGLPRCPLAS